MAAVTAAPAGVLLRLGFACSLGVPLANVVILDAFSTGAPLAITPVAATAPVNVAQANCHDLGAGRRVRRAVPLDDERTSPAGASSASRARALDAVSLAAPPVRVDLAALFCVVLGPGPDALATAAAPLLARLAALLAANATSAAPDAATFVDPAGNAWSGALGSALGAFLSSAANQSGVSPAALALTGSGALASAEVASPSGASGGAAFPLIPIIAGAGGGVLLCCCAAAVAVLLWRRRDGSARSKARPPSRKPTSAAAAQPGLLVMSANPMRTPRTGAGAGATAPSSSAIAGGALPAALLFAATAAGARHMRVRNAGPRGSGDDDVRPRTPPASAVASLRQRRKASSYDSSPDVTEPAPFTSEPAGSDTDGDASSRGGEATGGAAAGEQQQQQQQQQLGGGILETRSESANGASGASDSAVLTPEDSLRGATWRDNPLRSHASTQGSALRPWRSNGLFSPGKRAAAAAAEGAAVRPEGPQQLTQLPSFHRWRANPMARPKREPSAAPAAGLGNAVAVDLSAVPPTGEWRSNPLARPSERSTQGLAATGAGAELLPWRGNPAARNGTGRDVVAVELRPWRGNPAARTESGRAVSASGRAQ